MQTIRRKSLPHGKGHQGRTQAGLAYVAQEAYDEDGPSEGSEVDQEVEDIEDFVVADGSVEPSSPSAHRRLDSSLREQEAHIALKPYFPLAFAECRERPLDFNFDLFLLDNLVLPTHISARGQPEDESTTEPDEQQPVTFENAEEAIRYCREKLESGWKVVRANDEPRSQSQVRLSHEQVNKWKLFKKDGYRISRALRSGQDNFDSNLHLVRMDRLVRISFHTLI